MTSVSEVSTADELMERVERARSGKFYDDVAVANVADLLALRNTLEQLRCTISDLRIEIGLVRARNAMLEDRISYYTAHDQRLAVLGASYEKQAKQKHKLGILR